MRARSAPPAERWRSSSATGAQGGGGCTGRGYRSRAVTSPYETPWAKRIFAKKYTSAPSSGGSAYPCARRQVRVAPGLMSHTLEGLTGARRANRKVCVKAAVRVVRVTSTAPPGVTT